MPWHSDAGRPGPRQHRLRDSATPRLPSAHSQLGALGHPCSDQPANSLGAYSTTSGLVIHWYASQNWEEVTLMTTGVIKNESPDQVNELSHRADLERAPDTRRTRPSTRTTVYDTNKETH